LEEDNIYPFGIYWPLAEQGKIHICTCHKIYLDEDVCRNVLAVWLWRVEVVIFRFPWTAIYSIP
jgi:hypothetical protein